MCSSSRGVRSSPNLGFSPLSRIEAGCFVCVSVQYNKLPSPDFFRLIFNLMFCLLFSGKPDSFITFRVCRVYCCLYFNGKQIVSLEKGENLNSTTSARYSNEILYLPTRLSMFCILN